MEFMYENLNKIFTKVDFLFYKRIENFRVFSYHISHLISIGFCWIENFTRIYLFITIVSNASGMNISDLRNSSY